MGYVGEKGTGLEPLTMPVAVCIYVYYKTKVGHWETEKAMNKLKIRVRRPALILLRPCKA